MFGGFGDAPKLNFEGAEEPAKDSPKFPSPPPDPLPQGVGWPNAGWPNAGWPNEGWPNEGWPNTGLALAGPNEFEPDPNACWPNAGWPNTGLALAGVGTAGPNKFEPDEVGRVITRLVAKYTLIQNLPDARTWLSRPREGLRRLCVRDHQARRKHYQHTKQRGRGQLHKRARLHGLFPMGRGVRTTLALETEDLKTNGAVSTQGNICWYADLTR